MMPSDDKTISYQIMKFDKNDHDRTNFNCGFKPIDNFLKSSISGHIKNDMISVWVATERDKKDVIGFYTLGAMAVRARHAMPKWQRLNIPDIPVIYIKALAVTKAYQGQNIGTALLMNALRRCVDIADQMGAAAVVLDVLRDSFYEKRMSFYAEFGFRSLEDPDNVDRLFLPMADIRASMDVSR